MLQNGNSICILENLRHVVHVILADIGGHYLTAREDLIYLVGSIPTGVGTGREGAEGVAALDCVLSSHLCYFLSLYLG